MVTSAVVVNLTGHTTTSSSSLSYNSDIRWHRDYLEVTGDLEG
jgi:hypothetical protein